MSQRIVLTWVILFYNYAVFIPPQNSEIPERAPNWIFLVPKKKYFTVQLLYNFTLLCARCIPHIFFNFVENQFLILFFLPFIPAVCILTIPLLFFALLYKYCQKIYKLQATCHTHIVIIIIFLHNLQFMNVSSLVGDNKQKKTFSLNRLRFYNHLTYCEASFLVTS